MFLGLLGLVALAGNVLAILQLLADRCGDANMAAIWLFSHREAVGNAAVVVAAALVAWLGSAWPNPVIGTAGPFLHSLGRSSAMRWQT